MYVLLQVLALCGVRKLLEYIFTTHEIRWLDDVIPEDKKKEDDKKKNKKRAKKIVDDDETDRHGAKVTEKYYVHLFVFAFFIHILLVCLNAPSSI